VKEAHSRLHGEKFSASLSGFLSTNIIIPKLGSAFINNSGNKAEIPKTVQNQPNQSAEDRYQESRERFGADGADCEER
jgi:hypothetical protein